MCGIVGYFPENIEKTDTTVVYNMNIVQRHRGPDDAGLCTLSLKESGEIKLFPNERVINEELVNGYMGFSRLSILDLSSNGHQPMLSNDKRVCITFNGEIYNAFEIKKNDKEIGNYPFKSNTDTEVILALYKVYGIEKTVKMLNGMFSFAICDLDKRCLYLVRDRYGIKPLYYVNEKKNLLYASEIKSITNSGIFKAKINVNAYKEAAVFGYCYGRSMLEGVEVVNPGEIIKYDLEKREISHKQYYNINDYYHPRNWRLSYKNAKAKLRGELERAVKRQMISDVKLGCQLSGGVDSSLTTYFATANNKDALDGISIVLEEQELSEELYIDIVSNKLSVNVHKILMDEEYYLNNLIQTIYDLDTIPKFYNELGIKLLAEEAKKHVTVLLSGEGADELMCGYSWMCAAPFNVVETGTRTIWDRVRRRIVGNYVGLSKERTVNYESIMIYAADAIPLSIAKKLIKKYDDEEVCGKRKKKLQELKGSVFDKQIKYEMLVRLPALLNRQDKTTMSHSIENRVPFLDNDFVDATFSIPANYFVKYEWKNRKNTGKKILKDICAEIFGDDFAYRTKSGFPVPVEKYLRNEKISEFVNQQIIPQMKKRNILDAEYVRMLYENVSTISWWENYALFLALSLEIWAEIFVDRIIVVEN